MYPSVSCNMNASSALVLTCAQQFCSLSNASYP